jgi:hypothetical protein
LVVAAVAAGLIVSVAPRGPDQAAATTPVPPTIWIAAQINPLDVGLDPVASQISRDGSTVGFVTTWGGIDPGDVLLDPDLFEYSATDGHTRRVNVTPGLVTFGNGWLDSLSADGSILSLTTGAALVADDTNGQGDVYVLDQSTGQLQRVSVDEAGRESSGNSGPSVISSGGRIVAFAGSLSTEVNRTEREVWLRDLRTGQLEEVSVAGDGTQADARSDLGTMSDDGRYVSFWSPATNLPGGGGREPTGRDFYIRDRFAATTTHGIPSAGVPESAVMSGDGDVVAYVLDSVSEPSQPRLVHVWDRRTGIDRVLRLASPFNPTYRDWGVPIALNTDGRYVLMEVPATPSDHLAITTVVYDTATDTMAFPAVGVAGDIVTSDARNGGITADGTKVLFSSWADGVAAGDTNGDDDLFLRTLAPGDFRPAPLPPGLLGGPVGASARAVRVSAAPAA